MSLDLASIADGDVLLDGTVYVEGNFRIGSAGFFGTYADKTRQPSAVVLETIDLTYGVAQWGTSSLDTAEGTQVGLGQAAVGSMLLTGGYTIDGSGTAAQYDPAAGTFATGVAVTPANVDAKGNLQNPVTGSRVFRRS